MHTSYFFYIYSAPIILQFSTTFKEILKSFFVENQKIYQILFVDCAKIFCFKHEKGQSHNGSDLFHVQNAYMDIWYGFIDAAEMCPQALSAALPAH